MAVPTVYNVGTVASGTGAVSPGLPTGTTTDDILVLLVENEDATGIGTVTGYSVITSAFASTGTPTRLTALWKRAGSSESAPSVPDPGDHAVARIIGVRGCVNIGSPVHVSTQSTELVADTTVSIPGFTTNVADCLVVAAFSTGQDIASTAGATGWTNASLTSVTEQVDNWVVDGLGGGMAAATGGKATPGTVSATTATLSLTANFKAHVAFALTATFPIPAWKRGYEGHPFTAVM